MHFSIAKSLGILKKTPEVLTVWLSDLDDEWIVNNEGENTWNVKEVVAHLIVCEKTNWIARTKIILAQDPALKLIPVDMTAHIEYAKVHSLAELMEEFRECRKNSVGELQALKINDNDLGKTISHPVLGEINLRQLLSAWVSHDLSHIAQISRIMAAQYKENIGPFITFLKFLNKN